MANLVPTPSWDGVYQIETTDTVLGGPGGVANLPAQNLANQNLYARKHGGALPFLPGLIYDVGDRVKLANGDIVRSTISANTSDPNVDMTGWVKVKVEIYISDFGADRTGVLSSNSAFRKALAFLDSKGGGVLRIPAGEYRFERELNPDQPPLTATFTSKTAGFWAKNNINIIGDGRDVTKFIIPCPGQRKGAVDNTQFWQFLAHGDNFSLSGIHFSGDVPDADFEFISFWGGGIVPCFLVYANTAGTIFGKNSNVSWCRFTNTRGFCYATSLLHVANFLNNEVRYTNGVNLSGKDVHVDYNTWYMSELIESSGEPYALLGADKTAGITFNGNICRECNGGALGGNINPSNESKTFGYQFNHNILINNTLNAAAGFSITNNAIGCEIIGNTILGLFGIPLSITSGGIASAAPSDVQITGGLYRSTRTDLPSAVGVAIGIDEGTVTLLGVVAEGKNAGLQILGGASTAKVYVDGGTKLIGQYGIGFGTTTGTQVILGNYNWIPTTTNTTNLCSNLVGSASTQPLKLAPRIFETKDATQPTTEIVEFYRKYGGSQADPKYSYFLRYANGRIGWGDPNTNNLADVYLERKANNVLGLDTGDCFRTGVSVTASRPDPISTGKGSQYFDATLNKPIWSDGGAWRDASGAIV